MFDQEFLKWVGPLGVGGVLAYYAIRHYNEASRQWLAERKEMAEQYAKLFSELLLITKETIRAMTENTLVLKSLHGRVDTLELLRVIRNAEGQPVDIREKTGPIDTSALQGRADSLR